MNDATAAPHTDGLLVLAPAPDRRRVLTLALLAPVAMAGLAACGPGSTRSKGPDPLVALAAAARADADLVASAVAANPALGARITPLRAARTEHAAALDAEVARAGGTPAPAPQPAVAPSAQTSTLPSTARSRPPGATTAPSGTATAPGGGDPATLATVREAVVASQRGAADLVPDLPPERVGLVASVAACCAAYAAVLA